MAFLLLLDNESRACVHIVVFNTAEKFSFLMNQILVKFCELTAVYLSSDTACQRLEKKPPSHA